jgi:uncharacterized protein (TIGR02594 family)
MMQRWDSVAMGDFVNGLSVVGVGATIAFGLMMVAFPNMQRRYGFIGMAVGVVIMIGGVYIGWPTPDPPLVPETNLQQGPLPPWMYVALKEVGEKRDREGKNNPKIIEYERTIPGLKRSDKEDWAPAFVEWSLEKANIKGPKQQTISAWLNWGKVLEKPEPGCIVIFSFQGLPHIGFFYADKGRMLQILGGNQDGEVKIKEQEKSAVQGYRMPVDWSPPPTVAK